MGSLEPDTPQNIDKIPNFWDLLSETDKNSYKTLKLALDASISKRNRGHRMEAFDSVLNAIHRFAERHDENDWRRFLVCGLCWMDNMIAINTRQLRLLISKCKSSINGSLHKLGYTTNQSHTESWKYLFDRIPYLKDNFPELRQWTLRSRASTNQQIVAYVDSQNVTVPKDPAQPIQMQISVPNISANVIRGYSRTSNIHLNLVFPPNVVTQNSTSTPNTISGSQSPVIVKAENVSTQPIQLPFPPPPPPPPPPVQVKTETASSQPPANPPYPEIAPKGTSTGKEAYCPLKYRSQLMHRQSSISNIK
ncbi:hypothetical protein TVAG_006760 [Trichomonas vaginalis G3]|uniref:Initiator binding domain-containing protein n=1 Tax=Trichomonas vaginalis (strain ATCC PRA-98 / G3) TaxID=412133 RepID=A2FBZ9_TRIV3|nr:transcription-initiator DNA-binding domain ibd family [Trichomonas vaginalis G3]EAX97545.1 hypothetical protein TVAG_006760 [Trichomonas vaginalis G3]KAI5488124.1 transcription-initiator DNA-binding domain ibd family [Trichomonas vaginalis G3]|eukprot:XP_001310475.1 hypothetical protein [Trichomonas vaginalis G3]